MSSHFYAALDLGTESGQVVLGHLENGRIALEAIHRFGNGPARVFGTLRWDVIRIFEELKVGLRKLAERGVPLRSVSTSSWGVDYALFRERQPPLSMPFHYRDRRTDATFESTVKRATKKVIFENTGSHFVPFNTLYQLVSDQNESPELLQLAEQFLPIGDYVNYLFSGEIGAEESLASTTQLYDPQARNWSHDLIHLFGFSQRLFPPIIPSCVKLGNILPEICDETGLRPDVGVIATCSHDTGAAVAALPAEGQDWAYLGSGTWSLVGIELPKPIVTSEARDSNFTNEAGFGSKTRLQKSVIGLWLVEECRRIWKAAGETQSAAELDALAEEAEPLRSLVDPSAPQLLRPDDMAEKIRAYCESTGQPAPDSPGEYVRCIYESLALSYRRALDEIHHLTGRNIQKLHIFGTGSQSRLFNQTIANATEMNVIAGPVEATAMGNVLLQALALGHLEGHDGLREVVRNSCKAETYHPLASVLWQGAYERFGELTESA